MWYFICLILVALLFVNKLFNNGRENIKFLLPLKIIKSIERRQNSLLESPTGSGKSLALLCSSLAWLMVEKGTVGCVF